MRVNCNSGIFELQICFVVGENLRKQVLSEKLNAARSRKKERQIQELRSRERKPNLKI